MRAAGSHLHGAAVSSLRIDFCSHLAQVSAKRPSVCSTIAGASYRSSGVLNFPRGPHSSPRMGSFGWCKCYWCQEWAYSPYIPDGIGAALCSKCLYWFILGGGPYWPSAEYRARSQLYQVWHRRNAHRMPDSVAWQIIEYLHEWHEP